MLVDLHPGAHRSRPLVDPPYPPAIPFDQLDEHIGAAPPAPLPANHEPTVTALPGGYTQVGDVIVPPTTEDDAPPPGTNDSLGNGSHPRPGIEDICEYPDQVPPGIYDHVPPPGGEYPRHHTVYANFVGATLNSGGENSAENLSGIARSGHPFPAYTSGETQAIAVAQAIQQDLERWAIRVVYLQRPRKILPYTMVMVGGHWSDTTSGPAGGVAPIDCEDNGQRNVCYAFQSGGSATSQANVASQEIGHTFGLGHTTASDSVMAAGYAPTQSGDLGYHDGCVDIITVQGQSGACTGVNLCHCGVGDQQNDVTTMSTVFAPAGPDMVEPTIEITQPADGDHFDLDEHVMVEMDPWDDFGGYGWKLVVEDANTAETLVDQVDYDRGQMFDLFGLPAGTYTVRAEIQDHADHVTMDEITITIGPIEGGSGTGGSGGDTDSGTGSGTGSATGGAATTGATGTGASGDGSSGSSGSGDSTAGGVSGGDGGCGCRAPGPSSVPAGLLALVLFGRRRRRR